MADADDEGKAQKDQAPERKRTPRPCPVCKKMSVARYHPFCSKRCADIDLGRWLGGRYTIPAEEQPDFVDPNAPEKGDGDE